MLQLYVKDFLADCELHGFKPRSLEAQTARLGEFERFVSALAIDSVREIRYEHLLDFIANFGTPSVHVKKNRVWVLQLFFHFLSLHHHIDNNPASALPYPKVGHKLPHFLTAAELNTLLEHCARHAHTPDGCRNLIIILLLSILGPRISALIKLNVEDFDLPACRLWLREKGGIVRPLPLPAVLCQLVQCYLSELAVSKGPLLRSVRGKRISEAGVRQILQQVMVATKCAKRLHAHLFRHTAATLLNQVAEPEVVQYVLGHARRSNTEKYLHLVPRLYAAYMRQHPYIHYAGGE